MSSQHYKCLHCDYRVAQPAPRCPMCGGAMLADEQWSAAFRGDYNTQSFSLRSLLLFVTVICVFAGAFRVVPGLAKLLVIFAVIAIAGHYKPMLRWRRQAARNTLAGRASSVVLSIVVVLGSFVAGVIAFCTSCTAIMVASSTMAPREWQRVIPFLIVSVIGGGIVAAMVAVAYYRRNSPRGKL